MKRKYPIQLTDASSGAADGLALAPTLVTDEGVLNECREALNKWSSQFRVAVTRKLGDDAKLISAHRYHFYSFSIESPFATPKFELREGGTPQKNPIDISQLDLWQIHGADDVGDYDLEL